VSLEVGRICLAFELLKTKSTYLFIYIRGLRWGSRKKKREEGGNERGAPQINSPNTSVCVWPMRAFPFCCWHFLRSLSTTKVAPPAWRQQQEKKQQNYESAPQTRSPTPATLTTHTHTRSALAHSHSQRMLACRGGTKKTTKKRQGGGRASEREAPGATDVIKEIIVTMSAAEASSEWRHTNTRAPQTDTRTRTSDGRFVSRFDKLKNQQFKVEVRWVWSNLP